MVSLLLFVPSWVVRCKGEGVCVGEVVEGLWVVRDPRRVTFGEHQIVGAAKISWHNYGSSGKLELSTTFFLNTRFNTVASQIFRQ
ncbi:hypothetical protein QBC40DRAFT_95489 [Triangularia verruculosa]|uniref:Secreted protein n=1 Tax=Triangularia verruculosa TaxID=2587418 RepID=A0AAN7ASX1_9PEZI|nr:hypothetical protein QBC40DRAFT_95489 [Triangularia verruculosa]